MNLIGYTSAEETAYYRMNAHGDVVAVVDGFGETLKTYKYDAFGGQEEDGNEWLWRVLGVYEEDTNPFRYCAEYYDEETEFIYLRARYYSPEIQRFISEDPIKDGINWYAYCGNNPVMYLDQTGYQREAGYYTINGVYEWYDDPDAAEFGKDSNTYKTINDAGKRWMATDDPEEKARQHAIAENARELTRAGVEVVYLTPEDIAAGVTTFTIMSEKKQYKDVTAAINNALGEITPIAESKWSIDVFLFYSKVDHEAEWDIKREKPWNDTIKSTYPGSYDTEVVFNGKVVTPEYLGNYTYGYIGAAMGLSYEILCLGSSYAAGFPQIDLAFKMASSASLPPGIFSLSLEEEIMEYNNEILDQIAIYDGYLAYHSTKN